MPLPIFDAVSEAPVGSGVSSRTWNHTCGTLIDGCVIVCAQARTNTAPLNLPVLSVTYNGQACVRIVGQNSAALGSELWLLQNPPSGTSSVVVTWSGNIDNVATACAVSYGNVRPLNPVHIATGDFKDAGAVAITFDISPTISECLILDGLYQTEDTGQTVGAGQTARSNRIVTGLSTDAVAFSEEPAPAPGTVTMSWTASAYFDYAHPVIALAGSQLDAGDDETGDSFQFVQAP